MILFNQTLLNFGPQVKYLDLEANLKNIGLFFETIRKFEVYVNPDLRIVKYLALSSVIVN